MFQLFEKIDIKISELAYKTKPSKIDLKGIDDAVVKTLPLPLQTVFFTNQFEAMLAMGDVDKEFYCEDRTEKIEKDHYFDDLMRYYAEMQNTEMIALITAGKKAKKEKDFDKISQAFEQLEPQNDALKWQYIKNNSEIFELK